MEITDNKKIKILVAVLNEGNVHTTLSENLGVMKNNPDYDVEVKYFAEKPISYNRNYIVQKFLAGNWNYLMMIDDDTVPPASVINLADYKKDIIGALYFMYQKTEIMPVAFNRAEEGLYEPIKIDDKDGMVGCDAVGTGVIMLSRKVLEDIKAPFVNEYDADGIKLFGLDIAFCRKAREKGYKIYVNLDYVCDHWQITNLRTFYNIMYQQKDKILELKEKLKQYENK